MDIKQKIETAKKLLATKYNGSIPAIAMLITIIQDQQDQIEILKKQIESIHSKEKNMHNTGEYQELKQIEAIDKRSLDDLIADQKRADEYCRINEEEYNKRYVDGGKGSKEIIKELREWISKQQYGADSPVVKLLRICEQQEDRLDRIELHIL